MIEFHVQLEEEMARRGVHIRGKIDYSLTDKFQRFADANKGYKRSKDLFVILHDYDRGATFGDWHYPDDWMTYWNKNNPTPSYADLKKREIDKENRLKIKEMESKRAEYRAELFWDKSYIHHDASIHPYAISKQIEASNARLIRSYMLVPIHNVGHEFVTMQVIKPNGFKRFWKGVSPVGLMCWISPHIHSDYRGIIRICEGYATGCTIHEVSKSPVVCAMSAGNLYSVAVQVRRKFIHATIKICADNDAWGAENTGLKHALVASKYTGISIHYPVFDGLDVTNKPTDFNDLYILGGENVVKKQLVLIRY
jgi:putative DNA primase/helicase